MNNNNSLPDTTLGINDSEDTVNAPRQVYDSEMVQQSSSVVKLNTGYNDPLKGYQELSSTYHQTLSPTNPVLDFPSRKHHLFFSYLVDWITLLCIMGFLAMWWYPTPKFYFYLEDPHISYPIVEETVSASTVVLIMILGPIVVVTIAQIWVRSFRDWHQGVLACLSLFACTQVICAFMWALVGGLRPSFLAYCKPDITREVPIQVVPGGISYYSDAICTCSGYELNTIKHAFPSGHAAGIVATAIYLSIYVSAKLKLYDNRSHLWKLVFVLGFIVVAMWISFSRIRDGRHRFSDVIVGMLIGVIIAPLIYRLNFCSLMGPDNHIPTRYTWTGRFFPNPFIHQFRNRNNNNNITNAVNSNEIKNHANNDNPMTNTAVPPHSSTSYPQSSQSQSYPLSQSTSSSYHTPYASPYHPGVIGSGSH